MQWKALLAGTVLGAVVVAAPVYLVFGPQVRELVTTTGMAPDKTVMMPTRGSELIVSRATGTEHFTRSSDKSWYGIPLGTTYSSVSVKVTYNYVVRMDKEWPITIRGTTAIVRAGEVVPLLPVAFDTRTVLKHTSSGWARFDKWDNLQELEKTLTPELARRSAALTGKAAEAGRQSIAEFVTRWLLKEHQWQRDPSYRVVVLYPGEPEPAIDAPRPGLAVH